VPSTIAIKILANATQALSTFKTVNAGVEGMQTKMQKAVSKTQKLRAPAAAVLAGIGGAALKAGQDAAELSDTLAASVVILGNASAAVQTFGDNSARNFGISKNVAITAADAVASIGSKAGLSGKALSDFSTTLVARAGDAASLYGGDSVDAVAAFQSALVGQMEPIRRYGVLLDDASLRIAGVKLGLLKTTKDAISPANKALIVQSEIMRQTSRAAGDFSRTLGSSAKNQQQAFSAQLSDVTAKFGMALLPAMVAVTSALSKFVGLAERHQTTFKILAGVFAAVAASILLISVAQKIQTAFQWLQNAAWLASPITWLVIGLAAIAVGIIYLATKTQFFQVAWGATWGWIKTAFKATIDWFVSAFDAFVGFFTKLPGRIGRAASGMWDGIKDAFKASLNWIISGWNALDFTLPSVNIPGLGKVGGFTLGVPDIPLLERGGIVRSGGLAVLHPAEVITPRGGAGGNAYYTINNYMLPGADPKVGRAITDSIEALERTTGRRRLLPNV
jgi:hypothetical protein